tara:strand:+ start:391 stop:537 length:147 start_codon:yes stop_codon:yes gene_type:complete
MRSKELLKNLKLAIMQDYLYNSEELSFMKEQLEILQKEIKRSKPKGFK